MKLPFQVLLPGRKKKENNPEKAISLQKKFADCSAKNGIITVQMYEKVYNSTSGSYINKAITTITSRAT